MRLASYSEQNMKAPIIKIFIFIVLILMFCQRVNAVEVMDEEYRTIAFRIIDKVIELKKEYPHFTDVDRMNQISQSSDKFSIQFSYSHGKQMMDNPRYQNMKKMTSRIPVLEKDGIDLDICFFKGPWMGQAVVMPQAAGDMNIVVFLKGNNLGKIYSRIHGFIDEEKDNFKNRHKK